LWKLGNKSLLRWQSTVAISFGEVAAMFFGEVVATFFDEVDAMFLAKSSL
jgi:hypothetical protein